MQANGRYVKIEMDNVKGNANKSVAFLNTYLPKHATEAGSQFTVVFLGETHGNQIDMEVTRKLLATPPLPVNEGTFVYFEREMGDIYPVHNDFGRRTVNEGLILERRYPRSVRMAERIKNMIDFQDLTLVYIVCGSAHATEIYDTLVKKCTGRFLFLAKMSSAER